MCKFPVWEKVEAKTMTEYSGKIDRQALINFIQEQLPKLTIDTERHLDALYWAEKSEERHVHMIHALNEGLMHNYGYTKALNDICDWAKKNMEETPPVELVDVQDLKERFNAGK